MPPASASTASPGVAAGSVFVPLPVERVPVEARPVMARAVAWVGGANAFASVKALRATLVASQSGNTVAHTIEAGADGSLWLERQGRPKSFDETLGANGSVGWIRRAGQPEPALTDANAVRSRAAIAQQLNPLGPVLAARWQRAEVLPAVMIGEMACDAVRLHGENGLTLDLVVAPDGRPVLQTIVRRDGDRDRWSQTRWLKWESVDGLRLSTIIDTRSDQGAVGFVASGLSIDATLPSGTALPPEVVALVASGAPVEPIDGARQQSFPEIITTPAIEEPLVP